MVKAIQQLIHADLAKLTKEERLSFFRWTQETCSQAPRSVRERFKPVAFEASLEIGEALFHEALSDFEHGRWARALSLINSHESAMIVAVEYEGKMGLSDKRAGYLFGGQFLLRPLFPFTS